jgi:hypothetical protein
MTQNEVKWFKFIGIYIFEGRNVELFQKKSIHKTNKTNITSLLHVFLLKRTQNVLNLFKFIEMFIHTTFPFLWLDLLP